MTTKKTSRQPASGFAPEFQNPAAPRQGRWGDEDHVNQEQGGGSSQELAVVMIGAQEDQGGDSNDTRASLFPELDQSNFNIFEEDIRSGPPNTEVRHTVKKLTSFNYATVYNGDVGHQGPQLHKRQHRFEDSTVKDHSRFINGNVSGEEFRSTFCREIE